MKRRGIQAVFLGIFALGLVAFLLHCAGGGTGAVLRDAPGCTFIQGAVQGPAGTLPLHVEKVVDGLETIWAMVRLPDGDILLSERPGRIRLLHGKTLLGNPVATFKVGQHGEDGLLGLALDPDFATNQRFFVYYTGFNDSNKNVNRVERWILAPDHRSATFDLRVLDNVPAASVHNGGRIHIGPDRKLYVGIGDATGEERSQDPTLPNGKILRLELDGSIPTDNPAAGKPYWVMGVRNPHGYAWTGDGHLWIADHGPTGEPGMGRGLDKLSLASSGDNLGWPEETACFQKGGFRSPSMVWEVSLPPGDLLLYDGSAIPEWKGDLVLTTLRSEHLHHFHLDPNDPSVVLSHDVYLLGEPPQGYGRLRAMVIGGDGALYFGTSNCDGRGNCPKTKDAIYRVTTR